MSFGRLVLVFACGHIVAVALLFVLFGIGLEGPRHAGHTLLWLLTLPASAIPAAPCALLPLNSAAWGFAGALVVRGIGITHRPA